VSALTALEGFDTLALLVNHGIASMELIVPVGVSACLLVALYSLPATLQILSTQYYSKGQG
jgi:hypothetical protein